MRLTIGAVASGLNLWGIWGRTESGGVYFSHSATPRGDYWRKIPMNTRAIFPTAFLAATLVIPTRHLDAQACNGPTQALDACRKAIDLSNFVAPQFAAALVGGNTTIGQAGALGGFGKFSVSVRSTHVMGEFPIIGAQGFNTGGAQKSTYSTASVQVPALSVDGALGLFRGLPVGDTHVGGLDALVSATYMSSTSAGGVAATLEGSNTNFGFGGRVGIIEETSILPGVAVSYLKRDMPRFAVTSGSTVAATATTAPGTLAANSLLVTTTSYRLTAGKQLGFLGVSGGYGQDKFNATSLATATVNGGTANGTVVSGMTRNNLFVGASVSVAVFRFIGEYGMATGGTPTATLNDLGAAGDKARSYYTLGVKITF